MILSVGQKPGPRRESSGQIINGALFICPDKTRVHFPFEQPGLISRSSWAAASSTAARGTTAMDPP